MNTINFPADINKIPETPGVYQFKDNHGLIIYIGKAKNLKNRVRSYASSSLLPKTAKMVSEAVTLSYISVESEFEALLLEARLVRKYMPVFNIELKDDKSPLYIGITSEEFPRVLTFRQTDLKKVKLKNEFGPYVDGKSAKYVLGLLRRVFPYSQHRIGKRACIYNEIGLCNPCPSAINKIVDKQDRSFQKSVYLKNVRRLRLVLSGKFKRMRGEMVRDMANFSKREQFEEAEATRKKIYYFDSVTLNKPQVEEYLRDPNFSYELREKECRDITRIIEKYQSKPIAQIRRIECFDIAHLSGTNPTASMVTFVDGEPDKNFYRHFKINKGNRQNNDVLSMREVVLRRSKHFSDWGKPDLVIVDGGKPQVAEVAHVLGGEIPIVGLAKQYETFVFERDGLFFEYALPEGPAKNLVVRIRNEAHRFARRLHHKEISKRLLDS